MRIEILSTGDEIMTGDLVDTNSNWLAGQLMASRMRVSRYSCAGDQLDEISTILKEIAGRADVALVTGGLGPTDDDLTAEAASMAAGDRCVHHPEAMESICGFFNRKGWDMPSSNRKQAQLPSTAKILVNQNGTAPGFTMNIGSCCFYFMPGVPLEMKSMFQVSVLPRIIETFGLQNPLQYEKFTVFGIAESVLNQRLKPFNLNFPGIQLGFRAHFPLIEVKFLSQEKQGDPDISREKMNQARTYVRDVVGSALVSEQGLSMEEAVGRALLQRKATLAVAESCTGGLIATLLTDVAGSSEYFLLSAVTYANEAKIKILGVEEACLLKNGAVHEETARQMAVGVRQKANADFGLATSGIAGPGGGSEIKPVGLVCIGIAGPGFSRARQYFYSFEDRKMNKRIFAIKALDVLRRELLGIP